MMPHCHSIEIWQGTCIFLPLRHVSLSPNSNVDNGDNVLAQIKQSELINQNMISVSWLSHVGSSFAEPYMEWIHQYDPKRRRAQSGMLKKNIFYYQSNNAQLKRSTGDQIKKEQDNLCPNEKAEKARRSTNQEARKEKQDTREHWG